MKAEMKSDLLRILVVDDNVDAATIAALFIEQLGHVVVVEYRSSAAFSRVQEENFDFYLLDIGLPEMDGHELAKKIKLLPNFDNATFAALTGYGSEDDKRKSSEAGFNYHFVKPIHVEGLIAALDKVLAQKKFKAQSF